MTTALVAVLFVFGAAAIGAGLAFLAKVIWRG